MKRIAILLALIAMALFANGQERSILYNERRQLKADTTFVLTPEAYRVWLKVEQSTLYHIIDCYKPSEIFRLNEIHSSCVISFTIDPQVDSVIIEVMKILDTDEQIKRLAKAYASPFHECFKSRMLIKANVTNFKTPLEFFIPITVPIEPLANWISPNGMLTIRKPYTPTFGCH